MSYTSKYPGLFKAPLFIRESGYWQNHMAPYLEVEGWAVIVVDCAGVTSIQDFAYRLVESIDSGYSYPEGLICVGLPKKHASSETGICVKGSLFCIKTLRIFWYSIIGS